MNSSMTKVTFQKVTVFKFYLTLAMFLVFPPFSKISISSCILVTPKAMFGIIYPLTGVFVSVFQVKRTVTMRKPKFQLTIIF